VLLILTAHVPTCIGYSRLGIALLPVATNFIGPIFLSDFYFDRAVPYENVPQYSGTNYVQNSNDSYWLSNINAAITGVSPLCGAIDDQQSLSSRMAQRLLAESAESDGLFNPAEVEQALLRY
jgi:acyl-homoserine-lactone acylase